MHVPAVLLALALALLGGCATRGDLRDPGKPLSVSQVPYTVSALDEIRITSADGTITTLTVPQQGPLETADGPIPALGQSRETLLARLRRIYPKSSTIQLNEFRTNRVTVLEQNLLLQPGDVITVPRNFL